MIKELLQHNYYLNGFSTYKIGGAAEYFLAVKKEDELRLAVEWAKSKNHPITILGGGSNVLINDQGVRGLVIHLDNKNIILNEKTIVVGAGYDVGDLARFALVHNLSGLEWAIGIPGSLGGAIRGNAGAHGGSFDVITPKITIFNIETLSFHVLPRPECGFAYRHSRVKDDSNLIVWDATLELNEGDKEIMEKHIEEYLDYRRNSQPKEPSAGCIFKNFFAKDIGAVNPALYEQAEKDNKIRGGKIGAGYLIEQAGLMGYRQGGAEISQKHANFIINTNQAKSSDIIKIIEFVKKEIKNKYGVIMEEEVQYVGFN